MRTPPRSRTTAAAAFALALAAACSGGDASSLRQGSSKCPASPAKQLFQTSLCICEDFLDVGNFQMHPGPNGEAATGAVNGFTRVLNNTQVDGSWVAYGGLDAKANFEIAGDFSSAQDVFFAGNLEIGGDMTVGGDLGGFGRLSVDGSMSIAGDNRVVGFAESGTEAAYPGDPAAPCGCGANDRFDVARAVAEARTDNDNDAAGLPTRIEQIGLAEVRLGDGVYYFEDVRTIGATRFYIDGAVALYIDGELAHIGDSQIRMAPGAILDLYVNGSVQSVGHTEMAEGADPSSFRLYVGGTDPVIIQVGNQQYDGAIYAPQAEVKYVGNTQIRGSLFARTLVGVGNLELGYSSAKDADPDSCAAPGGDNGQDQDQDGPDGSPKTPDASVDAAPPVK